MNKKQVLSFFLLFLFFRTSHSTELPVISLLTCNSGEALYSQFGHTALRVHYPDGADTVFNFGMFDFETPFFYQKFLKGSLHYMLGTESISDFMETYRFENRTVWEQKLDLTPDQTFHILNRLHWFLKPENRNYIYRFSSKNCTTEPRDFIFEALKTDSLLLQKPTNLTVRKCLNTCLSGWVKTGVNLLLGSVIDKKISCYESLFLPHFLFDEIKYTQIEGKALVSEELMIIQSTETSENFILKKLLGPTCILGIVFMIFVWAAFTRRLFFLDAFLYTLIGIAGLLLVVLALFSEHPEMRANFNLLWCNPLYLFLMICHSFRNKKIIQITLISLIILIFSTWLIWLAGIQHTDSGIVILSFILCFSLIIRWVRLKNSMLHK